MVNWRVLRQFANGRIERRGRGAAATSRVGRGEGIDRHRTVSAVPDLAVNQQSNTEDET